MVEWLRSCGYFKLLNTLHEKTKASVIYDKTKKDDAIRREVIRHIRTFFNVEYDFFEKKYHIIFKDYFKKELANLDSFKKDQLLEVNNKNIILSNLGEHFSPQVANVFDAYNDQKFYSNNI